MVNAAGPVAAGANGSGLSPPGPPGGLRALRQHPWWLAAGVVLLIATAAGAPVQRLNLLLYDLVVPRHEAAPMAVVIAIDEASLQSFGAWPWSRGLHAALIERLRRGGATAIGYDVLFSEPAATDAAGDERLAAVLAEPGVVVLPVAPVELHRPASPSGLALGELLPLPALRASAVLAHVDVEVDADGVSRRVHLQAGLGSSHYDAFALALWRAASAGGVSAGATEAAVLTPAASGAWVRAHDVLLPEAALAPATIPFAQALAMPDLAERVRGRVVLVGVTARGFGAELAAPRPGGPATLPAVLFHARAYEALQAAVHIEPLGALASWAIAITLLGGMAAWPAARARGRAGSGAARGAWRLGVPLWVSLWVSLIMPLLVCLGLLHGSRTWWPPVATLLALGAGYLAWAATQRRAAAAAIERGRRDAHATLHAIADGVVRVDRHGRIVYLNPVARLFARVSDARGLMLDAAFAFEPTATAPLTAGLAECLRSGSLVRLPKPLRLGVAPGGAALRVTISPVSVAVNRFPPAPAMANVAPPEGAVIAFADVTEAAEAARRLDHAATHDALTGLPNRSLLQDRLAHAVVRALRQRSLVAVLFVDLDRFKRINDSLGHRQGDRVLQVTAQRLKAACRAHDTVIRWGGDEFVVLLEDLQGREAATVAAAKLVDAVAQEIEIDGMHVPCACSAGIALAPADGSDVDGLLAMADAAMYRAKSQSGANFQFFSAELNLWTRDRLALESGLRQGLRDEAFELHYQPQFELRYGRLVGFEALLRWRRGPQELLQPGQFIGAAEESGLIVELGDWVVHDAARQIARWRSAGCPTVPVAVNVSARQCVDRRIVGTLRDALADTGIEPYLLKLEITESTAMADADHVIALLEEVSQLGVGLAVDDFGTGYSSLSYLKRFPIDEIKIDRSFVRDIATDQNDAAIVRATIALAHGLGLPVVAEGVEFEAQRRFLERQRCDVMQGFLCGRPLPAEETTRWLATQRIDTLMPGPRRRASPAYRAEPGEQQELWGGREAH